MAKQILDENFLASEQRRFRRLEVSLPVWLALEDDWNAQGRAAWTLGYTRDISLGGTKVVVPHSEEAKWQRAAQEGSSLVLRFGEQREGEEMIAGKIRRAMHDRENNTFWVGAEYSQGSDDAKRTALKMGLATMQARRKWQGAFAVAAVLVLIAIFSVWQLRGQARAREQRIASLQGRIKNEQKLLGRLLSPQLAGTRAQGMDAAFQSSLVKKRIKELRSNMERLSNPRNADAVKNQRAQKRRDEGVMLSGAPATGAQVNLGIALPYGYAWPQIASDLEELVGRRIPTIVIFRDFKSPFPVEDAREARLRAKTLQITWEPWHFSNPDAIKLKNIVAGKHDKYIDSWALAAKSFGNELWIRWGHEFNGNWYPWSISSNNKNAKLYVAAFRHVRSRFDKVGAQNVRWVWCYNAENVPNASWNDPVRAYPGDNYVDMIAIDGYNFGATLSHSRWQSFAEVFGAPYDKAVSHWPRKPLIVGETGCATTGGDKADWIRGMDRALKTRFKKFQGVVWFEAEKEADWRMASSTATGQVSRQVWRQNYYRRGEP
jgi:hypothetical protein